MIWGGEISRTAETLFRDHYSELIGISRAVRLRRRVSDTLLTSDLINEAFLRLRDTPQWKNDEHFLCSVALAMRHVAFDHAKAKSAKKRGGHVEKVEFDEARDGGSDPLLSEDNLVIHDLIEELATQSPRQARIVDCRFFAGYTTAETAGILGVDARTVRRDWNKARAWFMLKLETV